MYIQLVNSVVHVVIANFNKTNERAAIRLSKYLISNYIPNLPAENNSPIEIIVDTRIYQIVEIVYVCTRTSY